MSAGSVITRVLGIAVVSALLVVNGAGGLFAVLLLGPAIGDKDQVAGIRAECGRVVAESPRGQWPARVRLVKTTEPDLGAVAIALQVPPLHGKRHQTTVTGQARALCHGQLG